MWHITKLGYAPLYNTFDLRVTKVPYSDNYDYKIMFETDIDRTMLVTQFLNSSTPATVRISERGPNYSAVGIGVFFISLIAFISLMVVPPSSASPW